MNANYEELVVLGTVSTDTQSAGEDVEDSGTDLKNSPPPAI